MHLVCGRVRTLAGQKDRLAGSRGMHDDEDDDDQRVVVSDWLPGSSGRWFYYGADGGGELMPTTFPLKIRACIQAGMPTTYNYRTYIQATCRRMSNVIWLHLA